MPSIDITQPIHVTPEEARRRLETFQAEIHQRFGLVPTWTTSTMVEVRRTGAGGWLRIEPSRVLAHIDLSFALTPLRGRIESEIRSRLAELFAD
jgi:putative polyhydroxyalkanoate system protein